MFYLCKVISIEVAKKEIIDDYHQPYNSKRFYVPQMQLFWKSLKKDQK